MRGSRCVRSRCLIILQEPLDVVEFLLRTQHVAEAAAQLLDDAACALGVDLARHLHRVVVAVFAPAQRTAKRIGVLLRARLAEPVRGHQARNASEPCVMRVDRCDQQVRVIRPPIIDLVVGDDLIFRRILLSKERGGPEF